MIASPLFNVAGYWIQECESCRHQFVCLDDVKNHVERVYADDYFLGSGAGYHDYLSEERLLIGRGRWYARKLGRYATPETVLDIGAAAGFTLRGFSEAGWQCHGIEPNRSMAELARQRFGIPVDSTSFESWNTERRFDLVTMLQVLPHFVDPQQALSKCSQALRDKGLLLIETWDRESWTARLFGRRWHERNPPSVLHWFSKTGLIQLAHTAGFEPVAQGSLVRWIKAGHARAVLRHRAADSAVYRFMAFLASAMPNQITIPYLADDLFWILFRKL